jgi:hypothetical protein
MGAGASVAGGGNAQEMAAIIQKMDVCPISALLESKKRVAVGRVLACTQPLISPLTFRRCVMYRITAEIIDAQGNSQILFTEKRVEDFFLTDCSSLLYIPVLVYDEVFVGKDVDRLPPLDPSNYHLYRELFARNGHVIDSYPTVRLNEDIFQIGEQIAILGRPEYTSINGVTVLQLLPTNKDQYDPRWYQKHNFDPIEMAKWESFISHGKLVCSDDFIFFRGINIPPISPAYQPGPVILNYNYEQMGSSTPQIQQMGGYPAQGQPMGGYPAQGQPMGGYPAQGQPMGGYPAQGQQMGGYPAQGQQMGGYPAQGQPMGGYPAQGQQMGGYPAQGQPMGGYPAQGQQMGGYPAQGQMGQPPPPYQEQPQSYQIQIGSSREERRRRRRERRERGEATSDSSDSDSDGSDDSHGGKKKKKKGKKGKKH